MMDGIGLDTFKHSLMPRNSGDVCVSLQYCKHKEHISADLYICAKTSSIFKKEKYRVIGPKLVVSVIQSAGPTVLSVKRRVFL